MTIDNRTRAIADFVAEWFADSAVSKVIDYAVIGLHEPTWECYVGMICEVGASLHCAVCASIGNNRPLESWYDVLTSSAAWLLGHLRDHGRPPSADECAFAFEKIVADNAALVDAATATYDPTDDIDKIAWCVECEAEDFFSDDVLESINRLMAQAFGERWAGACARAVGKC